MAGNMEEASSTTQELQEHESPDVATDLHEINPIHIQSHEDHPVAGEKHIKPKKPMKIKTVDPIDIKKVKLRTSKDVFDRLKWDSESISINSSTVSDLKDVQIGYKDRFLGICEIPFTEFVPLGGEGVGKDDDNEDVNLNGEIPFHRVYYFRTGGPPIDPFVGRNGEVKVREDNWPPGAILLWDRETRKDLIFNSGNSSS